MWFRIPFRDAANSAGKTAYYYITWGIWLRHCLSGHSDEYQLLWPRLLLSIPVVRQVERGGTKAKRSWAGPRRLGSGSVVAGFATHRPGPGHAAAHGRPRRCTGRSWSAGALTLRLTVSRPRKAVELSSHASRASRHMEACVGCSMFCIASMRRGTVPMPRRVQRSKPRPMTNGVEVNLQVCRPVRLANCLG